MSRDQRNHELRQVRTVSEWLDDEWVDSPMTDGLLRRLLRMPWDDDLRREPRPVSVEAADAGDMTWHPDSGHADHIYGVSHPWDGPGKHWVVFPDGTVRCRGCGHVAGLMPHSHYCIYEDRGEGESLSHPPAPAVKARKPKRAA